MYRFGVLLSCVLWSSVAAQSIPASPLDAVLARATAQAIEARHVIHKNPELGNREFETAKLIAAHLRSIGIEVKTGVAHTGLVGILRGRRPAP